MRAARAFFGVGLLIGAVIAVLVAPAGADKRADIKIKAINSDVIKGKVTERGCKAGRRIVVKFEPPRGARGLLARPQKIGKTKSNRKGRWTLEGEFVAGRYVVVMKPKKSKRRAVRAREEDAVEEEEVEEFFDDEDDPGAGIAGSHTGCSKSKTSRSTNTGNSGAGPDDPATELPECDNGKDDDADGSIDHDGAGLAPADFGCRSPFDTTEGHSTLPFTLPGDGASTAAWMTYKARLKQQPVEPAEGYSAEFNPTLHDSATVNHGPVAVSGTPLCVGATVMVSSGVGAQAPTTTPLSGTPIPEAAPDDNHVRFVIEIDDPPGGDSCDGSVDIRVAVDTR